MKRDLILTKPITSSFLSCEKDTEKILRKLFVESRPYSDMLKSLLVIQAPDCLSNLENYKTTLDTYSIARLIKEGYIRFSPLTRFAEHEQIKTYLYIYFDDFSRDYSNPEFRDCHVQFHVITHHDQEDLGDFQLRSIKTIGYIDGLINNAKLSGIGTLNFANAYSFVQDEHFGGFTLIYEATHGRDDQIEPVK